MTARRGCKAGEQSFGLLITDIIMSKKDGPDVIPALKKEAGATPILAISADANEIVVQLPLTHEKMTWVQNKIRRLSLKQAS